MNLRVGTDELTICPLGATIPAKAQSAGPVLACGPRDAQRLADAGYDIIDPIRSYGDGPHRRDFERSAELAFAVRDALLTGGFNEDLSLQAGVETLMQTGAWFRFLTIAGEHSLFRSFAAPGGTLDRGTAFSHILPPRVGRLKRWPEFAAMILAWANASILKNAQSVCPSALLGVAGGFPVALPPEFRTRIRQVRLRLADTPRWGQIVHAAAHSGRSKKPRFTIAFPVTEMVDQSVKRFCELPAARALPEPVQPRIAAWVGEHVAAAQHLSQSFRGIDSSCLHGIFQGLMPPERSALARHLKAAGLHAVNFTHGSIVIHGDPTEQAVLDMVASAGWISSPSTTDVFPRAPTTISRLAQNQRFHPARYRDRNVPPPPSTQGRPFRILHAGNYVTWGQMPWLAPNEFEYVSALHDFVAAAGLMADVELSVRIKTTNGLLVPGGRIKENKTLIYDPQTFFDGVAMRTRLMRSNEPSIVDAIVGADLVVSEGWTSVIHDALELGRPVLLHTVTDRFSHMPARRRPPTRAGRGAIYACRSGPDLGAMLKSIVSAHRDAPLTDDELAPYRWPGDAPKAGAALAALINPLTV